MRAPYKGQLHISILITTLYLYFLIFCVEWRTIIEIDPDEGYNVIKTLLIHNGYQLYNEIYSDQPPFFTYFLLSWFNLFGWSVNHGRMLIIFFSSLMIFGLFDTIRRYYGVSSALAGILFLIFSKRFISISIAIMLGLPSLSMLVISAWSLLIWIKNKKDYYLVISGIFFGLSISIKLFTLFLIPLFIFYIIKDDYSNFKYTLKLSGIWILSLFSITTILLAPVWLSDNPLQLFTSHINIIFDPENPLGISLMKIIKKDKAIFILSSLGLIYAFKERNQGAIFFAIWLLMALIILFYHYPVWYHHAFLILIPASLLAGSFCNLIEKSLLKKGISSKAAFISVILIICLVFSLYPLTKPKRTYKIFHPWHMSNDQKDMAVINFIKNFREAGDMIITSRPMYAFQTGKLVPPQLAVTSNKRYYAGLWNEDTVIDQLEKYSINIIILTNKWPKEVLYAVEKSMSDRYIKILEDRENYDLKLFIKKDLIKLGTNK